MTSYNHTPITYGAAANSAIVNAPLGQLDAALGDVDTTNAASLAVAVGNIAATGKSNLAAAIGSVTGTGATDLATGIGSVTATGKASLAAAIGSVTATGKASLAAAIGNVTTTTKPDLATAIGNLTQMGTISHQNSIVDAIGQAQARPGYTDLTIMAYINRVYDIAVTGIENAAGGYSDLAARLDAMTLAGGNVATLASGAAAAGQKIVDVDSTTGFIAGAYVAYLLAGGAPEYNVIDTVTSSTRLTMINNIGTGGIADNTYIAMISASEYAAANGIPHGATDLTLRDALIAVNQGVYNVHAYGAVGDGVTDDTAAVQAAFDAADAATGGMVVFQAGKTYVWDCDGGGINVYSNTVVQGNGARVLVDLDASDDTVDKRALTVPDSEERIEISGLDFYSTNSVYDATRYAHAAIVLGEVGGSVNDVHIHHCTFRDLFGDAVVQLGTGKRVRVTDCQLYQVAGNITVDAEGTTITRNMTQYVGGIECAGSYARIANNVLLNCATGINCGGSAGDMIVGQIVQGNVIADASDTGIVVNDACEDIRIDGNVVMRTANAGIRISGAGDNDIHNVSIANNTLRSCGATAGSTQVGILANGVGVTGVMIRGNYIHSNAADTNHDTEYGIQLENVTDVDISENIIEATTKVISLDAVTTASLGRNRCDTSKIEYLNATTFTDTVANPVNYTIAGTWVQDDVAASQTAVALTLMDSKRTEIIMPRAGSVVGIAVWTNDACTAGTLTVEPTINGTVTGLQVVLDGIIESESNEATQDDAADAFAAGDRIGVKITTNGSYAPTTADITVNVLVVLR